MATIAASVRFATNSSENTSLLFDPLTRTRIAVAKSFRGLSPQVVPSIFEINAIARRDRTLSNSLALSGTIPPPGGFGGGVSFKPDQLLYRDSTAAYYYLLVPRNVGSQPTADLLYMTSSNRASKGCEALVSFFKDRSYEAAFMIWDWSVAPDRNGGQFVVTMSYDQLAPYRIPLSMDTGGTSGRIVFEAIYITSSTRRVETAWVNEVFVHNNETGMRDCVWQHSFDWPTASSDPMFWWGPIFETFPSNASYATAPPLGFADATFVQDGLEKTLTPSDSDLRPPTENGFVVLWEDTNSGLIAKGKSV